MLRILLFSFFAFQFANAWAQPANDLCGNAITLTVGAACTSGTTVAATTTAASDGAAGCWGTAPDKTVWYQFTTGTAGVYSISTDNGGGTDTQMKLFTNCTGTLAPVGTNCNEDGGTTNTFAAVITTSLLASTTYFIEIDVFGGGTGTFCISIIQPPANDICSGAVTLTIGAACVTGTNVESTTEAFDPNPSCWGDFSNNSVWYNFVADDDSITVDLGSGTLGATTEAAVYAGNCATLGAMLGCTDNSTQINLTGLTVGTTYYILVDAQNSGTGTFCIALFDTPPPNPPRGNSCSNARKLFPGNACTAVTGAQYDNRDNQLGSGGDNPGSSAGFANLGASPDPTCSAGDATQKPYWVEFTATNTTTTLTHNDPAYSPPAVCAAPALDYAVYTGTCGALTQVDCFSLGGSCGIGCCNPVTRSLTTVVGTTYYVLITPQGAGTSNTRYLCITSATPSTPGNGIASDNCGTAGTVTGNTEYTINNANAGIGGTEPPLCVGSSENTVFVNWTVPATWTNPTYMHMYSQDCNASLGMQISVFSLGTTCSSGAPTCVLASNPGNSNNFTGAFTATIGSTYLIALDGNAGAGCNFKFKISTDVTLPVELLSFDALLAGKRVNLYWTTASEINNDFFTIERSRDGEKFETAGTIKGAGNSKMTLDYSFTDFNPFEGTSYYRLKQTDYNGSEHFSELIAIKREERKLGALHPNPANEYIIIPMESFMDNSLVRVYDSKGKIFYSNQIKTSDLDAEGLKMDLKELPWGIYFVSFVLEDGSHLSSKFLKN